MLKPIENWTEKNERCYFCDSNVSVKYTMTISDPLPMEVTVCNKCALLHIKNDLIEN